MPGMQAVVLWSVIVLVVVAAGAALAWQWRRLRAARAQVHALERQLAHAGSFALAGQLAASGAAELSQALGTVVGRADALVAGEAAAGEALTGLRDEALRAHDLLRRLLALVRPHGAAAEPVDLHELLRETELLLAPEASHRGIEVIVQPCPARCRVLGDRAQLQVVLLQLITNAMDAMEQTPPAHRRVLVATHHDGAGTEVQVSDRGHGFGARDPEALFAPYYTTHDGRMGLGLTIARGIVAAHAGRIEVRRRAGGGAVFTVSLPVAAAAPVAEAATSPARASRAADPYVVQP